MFKCCLDQLALNYHFRGSLAALNASKVLNQVLQATRLRFVAGKTEMDSRVTGPIEHLAVVADAVGSPHGGAGAALLRSHGRAVNHGRFLARRL